MRKMARYFCLEKWVHFNISFPSLRKKGLITLWVIGRLECHANDLSYNASKASKILFRLIPPAKPPRPPSEAITRWQGTIIEIGLRHSQCLQL